MAADIREGSWLQSFPSQLMSEEMREAPSCSMTQQPGSGHHVVLGVGFLLVPDVVFEGRACLDQLNGSLSQRR